MRKLLNAVLTFLAWLGWYPNVYPAPRLTAVGKPSIKVAAYVTNEFNVSEVAGIVNGIVLWERATNGVLTWNIRSIAIDERPDEAPGPQLDGMHQLVVVFHKAHSSEEWVGKWDNSDVLEGKLLGVCSGDPMSEVAHTWLVVDRLNDERSLTWAAAHEFGHALCLKHVKHKASIMSPFYNWTVRDQTEQDLEEFCRAWHRQPCTIVKSETK